MTDYDLYYWPVPFRGQPLRAILALAGKSWREHDADAIGELMQVAPADQPIGFTGPPLLIDRKADFALAQMPAIALYLGETLALVPDSPQARALTQKVVNDANDVMDELTLDGGRLMWTEQSWREFLPRLRRWMEIWEATATRHDLGERQGFLLGTDAAGIADIVTATVWSTMTDRFPPIATRFDKAAPRVAALTRRMQALSPLARLAQTSRENYGDAYCGGEIEASLRRVIGGDDVK